ncbi:hypothetical protein F5888DRAFT_1906543 [Russula emetica]|nr:hypothetical protein F5888DRAFT_1906543 [Russula emetica]
MRGVMKEHWCTRSQIIIILSNEFNSISAVTTSMSPKGHTKPSSVDATQASARLTMSPHSPFILAHDISRGILQPVIASINALLLMVMVLYGFILAIVVDWSLFSGQIQIGDLH